MKHDSIIAQEGYPFIVFSLIITVFVAFLGICWLLILSALISFFIIWFFRNPERYFREEEKVVISPADGKVIKVENIEMAGSMAGKYQKISIFMNVFNVHVNRIPYNGKIEAIDYHEGKFVSANLDKASSDNERNAIKILTENGSVIWAVQIAGLIARRIVCWVKKGDTVKKGERFGLIRFGSRVDVYLPESSRIAVKIGQKVKAGESPLGYLP
ncbi:MAG: phosphatidylserine decarboxylase family protein [Deltaproteobacteria bacterium HGW-Deltaproteobacteria-12]|jgi:phosphatidylserine decarboxylase|nr:MAG: phosphatidylserine decarboxylase family protein [Deltaproteobacteria bacterium HGW-Deltaproteobacteria-12]